MSAPEGRAVRVLTRKWPDSPHWEYDAVRLGADGHGEWIGVRRGTWLHRPDFGFSAQCDHVVVFPHDAWWVATLYGEDVERPVDVYVDITTPCTWSDDGTEVRAVDLDLDVIQRPDGSIFIDDEDEFADHQVSLSYPAGMTAAAERSCVEVLAAVTARSGPFDGTARTWLARLRGC